MGWWDVCGFVGRVAVWRSWRYAPVVCCRMLFRRMQCSKQAIGVRLAARKRLLAIAVTRYLYLICYVLLIDVVFETVAGQTWPRVGSVDLAGSSGRSGRSGLVTYMENNEAVWYAGLLGLDCSNGMYPRTDCEPPHPYSQIKSTWPAVQHWCGSQASTVVLPPLPLAMPCHTLPCSDAACVLYCPDFASPA